MLGAMGSPMLDGVLSLFVFLQTQGSLGAFYYSLFLVLWTLVCLPTTPLEVAAGYIFRASPARSIAASIVGKSIGSILAFIVGRWVVARFALLDERSAPSAGSAPTSVLGRARQLGRLLQAALLSRPVQTITMVRASPMPIAIKNYGLAALPEHVVPVRTFVLVTMCVNVPYSVAWSLTGSSASSLQDAISGEARAGGGAVVLKLSALVALFAALGAFASKCKSELERVKEAGAAAQPQPRSQREGAAGGAASPGRASSGKAKAS